MGMFTGKVAIVTGATSGIGQATAVAFGGEGARVVVAGRRETEGQKTAKLVREAGGEGLFVRTDVSRAADVEALVRTTLKTWGRLDIAFNNAGIAEDLTTIVDEAEADFDRVIGTNLKGLWLCMKYELAHMLKSGGGCIVNMASIAGLVGMPIVPIYTASKHAVIGLTRAAAVAHARANVRVNAICPGAVETDLITQAFEGKDAERQAIVAGHPIGRMGTPDEIAGAVVWLCSPQASFVTGHALAADGGYTAQ